MPHSKDVRVRQNRFRIGLTFLRVLQSRAAWRQNAQWFLAGAFLAAGLLLGFTAIMYLPLAVLGVVLGASLFAQAKSGAWMLPAGVCATTAALYAVDIFGGRGTCPYSSVTFLDRGGVRCGPPDELRIFIFALSGTAAAVLLSFRSHRHNRHEEPPNSVQD